MKSKLVIILVLALAAISAVAVSSCLVRVRRRCPVGSFYWRARVRACAHPGIWRWVRVCAPNSIHARIRLKQRFRAMTGRPCAVIVLGTFRRY